MLSGSGVGSIVLAPITDALISQYGWRNCFRIQSAIMLGAIVPAALFYQTPLPSIGAAIVRQSVAIVTKRPVARTYFELMHDWPIMTMVVASSLTSFGYFIPFIYVVCIPVFTL